MSLLEYREREVKLKVYICVHWAKNGKAKINILLHINLPFSF